MTRGKIIKGVGGFYYVHTGSSIYECRARGIFRLENKKPLVGDDVEFEITHQADQEGSITSILPRRNEILRPAVANVDQAMITFAVTRPAPNLTLLDRMLVRMEHQGIPCIICFNKADLGTEEEMGELARIYQKTGYRIFFVSARKREDLDQIRALLSGKTTVLSGPSGVGKSTFINQMAMDVQMETGSISEKIGRGRHTTRHAQLIACRDGAYLVDTPGFTSLLVNDMEKEELAGCFPEFAPYRDGCRFRGCSHVTEPDCGVRTALAEGRIGPERYKSYCMMYQELLEAEKKRYR